MSTNLSTIGIWIFFIFYFLYLIKKLIILPIIYICLLIFKYFLDYKKTEYQHDWSFRFEQLNKILPFKLQAILVKDLKYIIIFL